MLDQFIFSDGEAMPNAGSAYSTSWLDLGAIIEVHTVDAGTATAVNQFGPVDGRLWFVSRILVPGTGTSIKVMLYDCATTGGTYLQTDLQSPVITVAGDYLTAGKTIIAVPLPRRLRRFLKVYMTADGDMSDGTINSHLEYGTMHQDEAIFRV